MSTFSGSARGCGPGAAVRRRRDNLPVRAPPVQKSLQTWEASTRQRAVAFASSGLCTVACTHMAAADSVCFGGAGSREYQAVRTQPDQSRFRVPGFISPRGSHDVREQSVRQFRSDLCAYRRWVGCFVLRCARTHKANCVAIEVGVGEMPPPRKLV